MTKEQLEKFKSIEAQRMTDNFESEIRNVVASHTGLGAATKGEILLSIEEELNKEAGIWQNN